MKKHLTTEEKARAFDEALERARGILCDGNCSDIEVIFPQLRESEDERIRKILIEVVNITPASIAVHNKRELLDWLEKQKINTEGDFGRGYDCGYQAGYAVAMNEMKPKVATATLATLDSEKQQEIPMPNSTELIEMWHKEEAMLKEKDFRGDEWRLAYNAFLDGFAQGMMVKQEEQKPNIELIQRSWYMEGYHDRKFGMKPRWIIKTGEGGPKHELNPRYGQPLAEQQYYSKLNDLERAIHRGFLSAGVENVPVTIIKETAKDCLAQMKPAEWSEEDKNKIGVIIRLVEQNSGWPDRAIKEYVNWLKSLRPQPHWKPSEEQMEALESEIKYCYACGLHEGGRKLQSLYEQLKQLM